MASKRTNEFDNIVAKRIRARRLSLGMSQETLANHLGITFQQVQKYERAANRISVGRLIEIGKALEIAPESLLKGLTHAGHLAHSENRGLAFLQTRDGIGLTNAMERAKPRQRKAVLRFLQDMMMAA